MKTPKKPGKNKLSTTEHICTECNKEYRSQRALSLHLTNSQKCGHRKRNKTNHPDIGCSSNCYEDDVDSTSSTKNMTSKVINVKSNISKNRIDGSNSIDSNKNKSLPIEEVIPDISVNNPDDCSNKPDINSNNQNDDFVPKINDSNNFFDDDWMHLVPDMKLLD